MRDQPYRNAAAFRAGVEARIKAEAKAHRTRTMEEVRRQFLLQRFLARVFADAETGWVLKGGTGLLVRVPDARHSNDIDLLYPDPEGQLVDAVADLRRRAAIAPAGDLLGFEQAEPRLGGGQGVDHVVAQVKVSAYLGVTEYGRFPIDLSLNQRIAEPVERRRPRPVVELPGCDPLPEFVLYPLAEQIADKLCAMYGLYGPNRDQPSTRYRDLVDLVIIVTHEAIDAMRATEALNDEAKRRELNLPHKLVAPSEHWEAGYARTASGTMLTPELRTIDSALETVARCMEPILGGTAEGTWNPASMRWE
ncbi:nucleotidyl transferase AbiEii/AbiGii toxin family protein [Kribbella sp. NPDC026596]|uniref:nucleotidyl transferase AbiEii/AbiGii toxin family protein n=1 Tax=Kribbella sp. NPDC026596 TaxID=3155122 RepID=UPI0033D3DDD2